MDTQESPKERRMTEFAGMTSAESSSIVEQLAVSLMCWRMNLSMLACLTSMKKQLHPQLPSLQMYIINFPHNLPDQDEYESPWHDEQPEELE